MLTNTHISVHAGVVWCTVFKHCIRPLEHNIFVFITQLFVCHLNRCHIYVENILHSESVHVCKSFCVFFFYIVCMCLLCVLT
jgi:hypothetical protein